MATGDLTPPDPAPWPGTSALVVPVPAFEELVRSRWRHYDAGYVSADPGFAHAHVTVLAPFVEPRGLTDEVTTRVAGALAGHAGFTVRFGEVGVFDDGTVHVLVEDEAPLRELTTSLRRAFPGFLPYAGRYLDPRPHLTVDRIGPEVDVDAVRSWVAPLLPGETEVAGVQLAWLEPGGSRVLARWRLGG